MENMLSKNHPRFCSKYIQKLGIANEGKIGWCRYFELNGKYFIYDRTKNSDYNVGDKVLVVKKIPLPGMKCVIHEIQLAENYWNYEYFIKKITKSQQQLYEAKAETWFSSKSHIITEVSKDYIIKTYGFKKLK